MASCQMHRDRGLAVLVRFYRYVFALRQRGAMDNPAVRRHPSAIKKATFSGSPFI